MLRAKSPGGACSQAIQTHQNLESELTTVRGGLRLHLGAGIIYIYIYIYIYLFVYLFIYLFVFFSNNIYVYIYIYTHYPISCLGAPMTMGSCAIDCPRRLLGNRSAVRTLAAVMIEIPTFRSQGDIQYKHLRWANSNPGLNKHTGSGGN